MCPGVETILEAPGTRAIKSTNRPFSKHRFYNGKGSGMFDPGHLIILKLSGVNL